MSLTPLWQDGPIIAAHAQIAVAAMLAGAAQFAFAKGTLGHKTLGYVWVGAMAAVALSSFWIHEFRMLGPFSPIHLLSLLVLATLVYAIRAVRQGRIVAHKRAMVQLYALALILTGLFTLWPGRTMHAVVFGA